VSPRALALALRELSGFHESHHPPPAGPCPACGDRLWFMIHHSDPWACRSCDPAHRGPESWRTVWCRHVPPCPPPIHIRSAIAAWYLAPPEASQ
jgi:hypothetical protein